MRYLSGTEESEALNYMDAAAQLAPSSCCFRAKCGSVIVNDKEIIGSGFNSPPRNQLLDRCLKDDLPANFKSDKTCCLHAEQRAIVNAFINNSEKVKGSRIYFLRLGKDGKPEMAGKPFCTICSKMVLEAGIAEFALWHKEGVCVYGAEEYNTISFQYRE